MDAKVELKRVMFLLVGLLCAFSGNAQERQPVWPADKMPDAQSHQIASMLDEAEKADFDADKHRIAYLEWYEKPDPAIANKACMVLISGGAYNSCCDMNLIELWKKTFSDLGFQCVNLVYRTPRPIGIPIYQTAWEDGQRAIRLVRSEAGKHGFDPEK